MTLSSCHVPSATRRASPRWRRRSCLSQPPKPSSRDAECPLTLRAGHDPSRGPALRRRAGRRRPRRADARPAPAAEHRRAAAHVPDPVRRRGRRLRFPTGACWRWSGSSAADPRLGVDELGAARRGRPPRRCSRSSRRRRWSRPASSGSTRTCYHGGVSRDPRRQPRRPAGPRSPLRHAGVRPGQVAERDHRQAGDAPPDRRRTWPASAAASASTRRFRSICPVEPSHLDVPGDGLEFARTAAGFWHSTLSPMHGALLAATIANRGQMPAPTLIDRAPRSRRAPARAAGRHPAPRRRPRRRPARSGG